MTKEKKIKMIAIDTNGVVNRQVLIEEIFAELESLLMGAGKIYEEEEEESEENLNGNGKNRNKKPAIKEEYSIFPRSAREWENLSPEEAISLKSKLLEILEKKRLELIQSMSSIDRIVSENAV